MALKSFLVAAATFGALALTPAAAAPIGSFDSGNCYPYACNDSGSDVGIAIHYQQIYSAAEFSGPTSINSMTYFVLPIHPFPW